MQLEFIDKRNKLIYKQLMNAQNYLKKMCLIIISEIKVSNSKCIAFVERDYIEIKDLK